MPPAKPDQPDEPPVGAAAKPVSLDAIHGAGATYFGVEVAEVVLTLRDGRSVRAELPCEDSSDLGDVASGDEAPGYATDLLEVVEQMKPNDPHPMTAAQIAERAGWKNSGRVRAFLATLVTAKVLEKTNRGYRKRVPQTQL